MKMVLHTWCMFGHLFEIVELMGNILILKIISLNVHSTELFRRVLQLSASDGHNLVNLKGRAL
jgi:hypothetical protein